MKVVWSSLVNRLREMVLILTKIFVRKVYIHKSVLMFHIRYKKITTTKCVTSLRNFTVVMNTIFPKDTPSCHVLIMVMLD